MLFWESKLIHKLRGKSKFIFINYFYGFILLMKNLFDFNYNVQFID